jgi:hypothetical protein
MIQRRLTETGIPHIVHYLSHKLAKPGLLASISMQYIEDAVPMREMSIWKTNGAFLQIYFQIVWTLHRIRLIYPTFRHNDFSTNNVLIRWTRGKSRVYYDGGFTLSHTGVPFEIFICDFGLAWIPGLVENREALLIQLSGKHGFTAPWWVDTDLYRITTSMILDRWYLEQDTRTILYSAFNGLLDDRNAGYADNYYPVNRDSNVWNRIPTTGQLLFGVPLFDSFTGPRVHEITPPRPPREVITGNTGTEFDIEVSQLIIRVYSEASMIVRLKMRRMATGALERHYRVSNKWPELFAICAVLDAAGELGIPPDHNNDMTPQDWYRAANIAGARDGRCIVDALIEWNWATKKINI